MTVTVHWPPATTGQPLWLMASLRSVPGVTATDVLSELLAVLRSGSAELTEAVAVSEPPPPVVATDFRPVKV